MSKRPTTGRNRATRGKRGRAYTIIYAGDGCPSYVVIQNGVDIATPCGIMSSSAAFSYSTREGDWVKQKLENF